MASSKKYPADLQIDYPQERDRVSVLFRLLLSVPIMIVMSILTSAGMSENAGGIAGSLGIATALMILFRQRYPKWWFDFNVELNRFLTRISAYLFLLTDSYPSTEDHQSVHMTIKYPDVKKELSRGLPLVKWFLAIPHFVVLSALIIGSIVVTVIAWFAILFTGRYPRGMFDYVVGVYRWGWRVQAYAFLLTTDEYPPFSLR